MFQASYLQQQIAKYQPIPRRLAQQTQMRQDLLSDYRKISQIQMAHCEQQIYDELAVEEELDGLQAEAFQMKRAKRKVGQRLQAELLEKNQLLSICDRHEESIKKMKQDGCFHQKRSYELKNEKVCLERSIRDEEIRNEKFCLQNEKLRRLCEEQLERVANSSVDCRHGRLQQRVRLTLQQNRDIAHQLEAYSIKLGQLSIQQERYRTSQAPSKQIQIAHRLKMQIECNNNMQALVGSEQSKQWMLSINYQVLQKVSNCKNDILAQAKKQQTQLQHEVDLERERNIEMKLKLQRLLSIHQQMAQTQVKLSASFETCRKSDLVGVRQMKKEGYRFQRGLQSQRHFLHERQEIVDQYRKYLFHDSNH